MDRTDWNYRLYRPIGIHGKNRANGNDRTDWIYGSYWVDWVYRIYRMDWFNWIYWRYGPNGTNYVYRNRVFWT